MIKSSAAVGLALPWHVFYSDKENKNMQERNIHVELPEGHQPAENQQTPSSNQGEAPSSQVSSNPNPRANENLENPGHEQASPGGVGSEITDGEDA
jgi:hypothetical protein